MNKEKLNIAIENINNDLAEQGKNIVQKVAMKDKQGNIIGRVLYGYKPQYVIDAVNKHIGISNWRFEVPMEKDDGKLAVVKVTLFIREENSFIKKAEQYGQMNIIRNCLGDAYKGATTDALQKAFATLSIGKEAYRGALESIYNGQKIQNNTKTQQIPQKNISKNTPYNIIKPETFGMDNNCGVEFREKNKRVFAIEIVRGAVFSIKNLLTQAGFYFISQHNLYCKNL